MLESLDTADGESLRDIAAVTAELPRASSCESDLRAQGDFDRSSQEQVAEARRQLMRAHGRADAGDDAAARSIVVATLAQEAVEASLRRRHLPPSKLPGFGSSPTG
ncbi:hypothetical protein DB30_05120 [Enhygromyxa salina]|uniref:Uncharacterized protein n=1 Tax=Enhygromyxa salina TaxID=215803 RepID=A0A0C1ZE36_9BACT|nr:hypothetical protein [Enhygromyxa salina]KIG15929.1 hypothetical protein DB30_05120 [Enhygromyxa salina]